ncbi:DUF551 domain-containing protein [Enterobacter kobei]|uniref:DUF551 domain-containing protein n=1 Tax=Enterobacter kobei TaxID=208224 RepID=UPI002DB9DA82|nr:DUF551 domain-containing protein [Enterobacter kobei]MEB6646723.1 DUF551 domain-containing protein [Enterobacter kobei]
MITITREQLRERAREKVKSLEFIVTQTAFADTRAELEEELELARIALASLEAEVVGYVDAEYAELLKSGHIESCSVYAEQGEGCITLFTVPPAPVSVPGDVTAEDCPAFIKYDLTEVDEAWARGFNACRAAMLQSFGNSEQLNSPAIPDCWVACSERMPEVGVKVLCFPVNDEPIHATYNGQVWLQDISWSTSDEPIDNVISCNVFHWMPLPAAPQQEV